MAGDGLLDLGQQRLRIADEQIAHVLAVLEFGLQQFDRATNHVALQLHNASIEGHPAVHGREQTERPFAPDIGGFNGRAVFQNGQQRENGTLRKISVLQQTARFADDGAELELDRLKMRLDPFKARRLQRAEQLIAPHVS
jgi:hypothetical protein